MARVLYAWELGGGLGHVMQALPLLRAYRAAGHEVSAAMREVETSRIAFGDLDVSVLPAPLLTPPPPVHGHRPLSYAEVLLALGFGDENRLQHAVRAWLWLYNRLRPDVVLLDYAPAAMLAASIAGLRHCTIGHGFFLPPKEDPLPPFTPGVDEQRVRRSELLLLKTINAVRLSFGRPPLGCLAEFLSADIDFLTTWPELDHYRGRRGQRYWGPIVLEGGGGPVPWPAGNGPRVAAYLRGSMPSASALESVIASQGAVGLVHSPKLSRQQLGAAALSCPNIHWASQPYDMAAACARAQVVVCNGGFGTVWTALLAGVPVLCLPLHQEQAIFAARAVEQSVALTHSSVADSGAELHGLLRELLDNDCYRNAASSIASKYGSSNDNVAGIVGTSLWGR